MDAIQPYMNMLQVLFGGFSVVFLLAQLKRDNSIIDIFWGISFILGTGTLLRDKPGRLAPRAVLLFVLVLLWGLRLAVYLGVRNLPEGEDARYVYLRKRFSKGGYIVYLLKAFFLIFMVQMMFNLLVGSAAYYAIVNSTAAHKLTTLDWVGTAIFAFGLVFEATADA